MPGKGLVKRGRAGQSLRTTPLSKLDVGVPTYFKDRGGKLEEFGSFIPIYWIGSYEELEMQDFAIEVRTKSMLREKKVGELSMSLASLAQGSIEQEHTVMAWNEHARAGDEEVPLLQLNAIIYFQELFVFQLIIKLP